MYEPSASAHEPSALGWNDFFEQQRRHWAERRTDADRDPPVGGSRRSARDALPARIAAEHRGGYEVWSSTGTGLARLAGRLRHELEGGALPSVGDWVVLDASPGPDRTAVIEHVFDRRTVFVRGAAGREARAQVVAANVDVVFVVCGLDDDFNLRRIERYLARVRASGALPVVVLSKADLCLETVARRLEVERRCPGVAVHVTSALAGDGVEAVRATIGPGGTAAFVGSSGAGKSTLVNALLGEARMATGSVRARDGRGCHVTSHRQLVLLPGGGVLLDTPGMRELQLLDDAGMDEAFEDVEQLARECRFADCLHGLEPGCAVRAAADAGVLDPQRLDHYLQLRSEARAYERRHDQQLRKRDARLWGKLSREADAHRRRKRGE